MHKIGLCHRKKTWFPLVMLWHDHNKEDSAAMVVQGATPPALLSFSGALAQLRVAPEPGRREELNLTGDQQINILSVHSQHLNSRPGQTRGREVTVLRKERGDTSRWGKAETSLKARRHLPPWSCAPIPGSGSFRRAGRACGARAAGGKRSRSPPTSFGTFPMRPVISAVSTAKSCS